MYLLDLIGTFVFAVSGGLRAVRHELDALGIAVLAISTGVGGGLVRDVLLGATPPGAFRDEAYLAICLAGALAVFIASHRINPDWHLMRVADAIGLGVFAAAGAEKAAQFGLGPIGIVLMAAVTATGGGVIRDMLVREVPSVIKRDFYATATLVGGLVYVLLSNVGSPPGIKLIAVIAVTTGLRLFALLRSIRLPRTLQRP